MASSASTTSASVSALANWSDWPAIKSKAQYSAKSLAVLIHADWHEPCRQMTTVFDELAAEIPTVVFIKVDGDQFPQLAQQYKIESVPTVLLFNGDDVEGRVEGPDVPKVVDLISNASPVTPLAPPVSNDTANLEALVRSRRVMLFMKGSPEEPKCGFSKSIVDLLKSKNVKFGYFDILSDDTVRQGLKAFANWKTYPQLWVEGNFIGGLDIVRELDAEGELDELLNVDQKSSEQAQQKLLNDKLKSLIESAPIMLFMKGSPSAPQCGFSKRIVEILDDHRVDYQTFDILKDNEVREGLKLYSNWPTFPQLYVNGNLLGGLDIVNELAEEGELEGALSV